MILVQPYWCTWVPPESSIPYLEDQNIRPAAVMAGSKWGRQQLIEIL
jgi:hypothetical protein